MEVLFAAFDGSLRDQGFVAMAGRVVDATIVAAPRQRNSRDDNETVQQGGTPPDWDNHPPSVG